MLAVCYAEGTIVVYGMAETEVVLKHHAFKKKRFVSAVWHSGKFQLLVLVGGAKTTCYIVDCASTSFCGFINVRSAEDEKQNLKIVHEVAVEVASAANCAFVSGVRSDLNFFAVYDDRGTLQFVDVDGRKSISLHSISSPNPNDRVCHAAFHPTDSKYLLVVFESGFILWWNMIDKAEDASKRFEAPMKILACDVDPTGGTLFVVSHAGEIFSVSFAKKTVQKIADTKSSVVKRIIATSSSRNSEAELLLLFDDGTLELQSYARTAEEAASYTLLLAKKCTNVSSFHVITGSAWFNGHGMMRGLLAIKGFGDFVLLDDALAPVARQTALLQLQFHPSLFFGDAAAHKNTSFVSDPALIDSLLVDLESINMSATNASNVLLEGGRAFETDETLLLHSKKSIMVLNQKTFLLFVLVGQALPKIICYLSFSALFDGSEECIENYQISWKNRVLVTQTNIGNIFVHVFDFVGDCQEEASFCDSFLFKQLRRSEDDIGFYCKFKIFVGRDTHFSYYFAGYDVIVCHCGSRVYAVDLKAKNISAFVENFTDSIVSVDIVQLHDNSHFLVIASEGGLLCHELLKNFTGGLAFKPIPLSLEMGEKAHKICSACLFDKVPLRNIFPQPIEYSVGK